MSIWTKAVNRQVEKLTIASPEAKNKFMQTFPSGASILFAGEIISDSNVVSDFLKKPAENLKPQH